MDEPIKIERRGKYNKKYGLYICSEHGEYWQAIYDHNRGKGCKLCSINKAQECVENNRISKRRDKAMLYKDRLDNVKSREVLEGILEGTVSGKEEVVFICEEHGEYTQLLYNHYVSLDRGHSGCYLCGKESMLDKQYAGWREKGKRSQVELDIEEWCREQGFNPVHSPTALGAQEIDILMGNVGIEVDGCGHYECSTEEEYAGIVSRGGRCKRPGYHEGKDKMAAELGIILIHITDAEWKKNPEGCKCRILEAIDSKL